MTRRGRRSRNMPSNGPEKERRSHASHLTLCSPCNSRPSCFRICMHAGQHAHFHTVDLGVAQAHQQRLQECVAKHNQSMPGWAGCCGPRQMHRRTPAAYAFPTARWLSHEVGSGSHSHSRLSIYFSGLDPFPAFYGLLQSLRPGSASDAPESTCMSGCSVTDAVRFLSDSRYAWSRR